MNPHWKRTLIALGALIAMMFLIAACGGDDDDADATRTVAVTEDSGDDDDDNPTATPEGTDDDDDDPTATPEETDDDDGDDDDGGDDDLPPAVDGCEIVGDAAVSALIGTDMKGEGDSDGGCTWETVDEFMVIAVILTMRRGSEAEMQDYFDIDIGGEEFDGLGEAARWHDGLDFVEVLQGQYSFDVQVINGFSTLEFDERTVAVAVSEEVLQDLPN